MKRVLLLVVDGCTSRLLGPAVDRGELPWFAALRDRGRLTLDCISVFPSITPAATASIVTGRYPIAHGIRGMSWWNADSGAVSYFGDDVWTVLKRGVGDFLDGFLLRLNGDLLRAPTLFEIAERHGRRAACFNHLIFRGDVPHRLSQPTLLRLLPSVDETLTVYGPSWLCLGDFVADTGHHMKVETPGGVFNRFGLDDAGTAGYLRGLPSAAALPDFTTAYFADFDFDSHDHGPEKAMRTLRELDARLQEVFDAWGGLSRVLESTCVILTADHSHSDVRADGGAAVVLEDLLSGLQCADPGRGWRDGDDVMLCPNMRAAEVYVRRAAPERGEEIRGALLRDPRIDQIIWRARDGGGDLHVATADRGRLRFRIAAPHSGGARDGYGGEWRIEGDSRALDLSLDGDRIRYGIYPNALERIATGVDHDGAHRLWVTARPGYEFRMAGQDVHKGAGSHGSLHHLDSLVPLLVAGAPRDTSLPDPPRIVDAAPLAARLLAIPFPSG